MLFIIGMDKQHEHLMPLLETHCHRCGEVTQWHLWKEIEKASLFFIPVWRFAPDYLLVCEQCHDPVKLPREFGKALLEVGNHNDANQAELEALIDKEQHRSRIRP
ncbi:zinc ribbon domain-containing protein [Shewanella submarina]|uniref:Zinc-ribbon domain-containing protein n=1 Tax=Shewanella submarina TaxID=2016376 RepID=A0ABV7GJM5_9GAMM|nr:zinc ribbon domain-containing protein [Shewanella submarina]